MLIFIEKKTNRVDLYGSLKSLFDSESDYVQIKQSTMYKNRDLDLEDYEDENCRILKRSVIRSKHEHYIAKEDIVHFGVTVFKKGDIISWGMYVLSEYKDKFELHEQFL